MWVSTFSAGYECEKGEFFVFVFIWGYDKLKCWKQKHLQCLIQKRMTQVQLDFSFIERGFSLTSAASTCVEHLKFYLWKKWEWNKQQELNSKQCAHTECLFLCAA